MFRFSVSLVLLLLLASCMAGETTPKSSDKTRRDDSDSDSNESEDSTSTSDAAPPATMNYANMRIPSFNFPPPPHHYPPPPPPMYAQIPPPPMLMRMPMHNPHHNPFQMMPAASSFTAYYRPLPQPMPHMGHMMTSRMSLHPMHPLSAPFMGPPHPPRTMLPVMVPIKRWDHSSIFDSLINSDPGLDNSFLDEPLVFDEEELLAARRHISPRPPPAHRRESYDNFPIRRHKNREGYEPMPSENRYDEPPERHAHKVERHLRRGSSEFDDRYERDPRPDPHERHSERHMVPPPPPPPTSPSFERYEDHTSRDMMHAPPAEHMGSSGDEYSHSRDP